MILNFCGVYILKFQVVKRGLGDLQMKLDLSDRLVRLLTVDTCETE